MLSTPYVVVLIACFYPLYSSSFVQLPPIHTQSKYNKSIQAKNEKTSTSLYALKKVGIVGTGYVSALTSKLAGLSGYSTWMLHAPGEEEKVRQLIFPEKDKDAEKKRMRKQLQDNLILVSASDTEQLVSNLEDTEAIIIATDNPDEPMDNNVIQYIVNNAPNLKRIVFMSRNLNSKNMGFFVKASKLSANSNVWHNDGKLVQQYEAMERLIQDVCAKSVNGSITYSFIRAGTLKGGGCGTAEPSEEDGAENTYYPQYLTQEFYNMVKRDIVSWNYLFDCRTRKVKLFKGDTMPGPGNKAVFTATSYNACDGDTSRCAVAECMVQSLALEGSLAERNVDFAVGTGEGREMPSLEEWEALFSEVV